MQTPDPQCAFCDLPLPFGLRRPSAADQPAYCCYGCRFAAGVARSRAADQGASWILVRLGTAIFLSMNVMLMALVLYSRDIYPPDRGAAGDMAVSFYALLRYASLLLTALVLAILGLPIIDNALTELRQRRVSIDLLFAAGVSAAFAYSAISTFKSDGTVYFETACMLLIVVTLGRWFEAAGRHRTAAVVEALRKLMPDEVTVIRDQKPTAVRRADLRIGDHVLVRAGDHFPVDGVIIEHQAHIDEQSITGESEPVSKGLGDPVFAGTTCLDGSLTVRATAVGDDATLGRLIEQMKQARLHKGRYERLADRMTLFFVPAVFLVALAGALLGYQRLGIDGAITTLLAVTLVSCPCALGLATPLAIWNSMNASAAQGALFSSGDAIERLADVGTVVFDKTGTLTTGHATVTRFSLVDSNGSNGSPSLADAAGLAARTNHYVAAAVCEFASQSGVSPSSVINVETVPGQGVVGTVESTGQSVCLGNTELMNRSAVSTPPAPTENGDDGSGISYFAAAGRLRGVFHFEDDLRSQAPAVIARLQSKGLRLHILSGDRRDRVDRLANQLGIAAQGQLSPADKLLRLKQLAADSTVAMVGDGMNDAPALAAADVGIAMGCGSDITRASADLCLIRDDLRLIDRCIDAARKTVRVIKQNLFWAVFYNVFGIALALTGRLHPIFAALAMVLSSALVTANSRRLARWSPQEDA